ncbi:hypothetical protein niasHT_025496 [Heterodera trifolii]|uniref:Maf-like protein n=1 Tax=Heterodera trifolii TaxID=157864 RepID=A0ABD2J8T3_9BILA
MKSAWFLGNKIAREGGAIGRWVASGGGGEKGGKSNDEAAKNGADKDNENNNFVVILASASKDRLQLMRQIGLEPMVVPSNCPEDLPRTMQVDQFVEQTARQKATDVAQRMIDEKVHFDALIGCDTMVSVDGELIGKPKDEEDAFQILKKLSNRSHIILTGVCIIDSSGNEKELFSVESRVEFGQLSDKLISQYIMTGEPMGRAGAYAIQGKGAALVKSISGSFPNIIGLPLFELVQKLDRLYLEKQKMH